MRKSFVYAAGLICLALSITNCQKEPVDQASPASEPNFELFAQPVATRTVNDGLDTKWVAGDDINVFHAVAGSTTYVSDGEFTVKDTETGSFDGTIKTLDADKSYDWYAFYPYSSYNKTPAGVSQSTFGYTTIGGVSQTQTGNNSRAHLAGKPCPLYGISKNVPSDKAPSIAMNHLTSVIKVAVTNNSGEDLTVSSVSFTGTEDIVGTYYINFATSPVVYTKKDASSVSSTATLSVSNGEAIANGSSAEFYIAIKPFAAKSGSTLKLAVNGYEKTITLDNDITFTAGHIKPLNFNYNKKVEDRYVTIPWNEDFSGTLDKYTLVDGESVTKIYNEKLANGTAPELLIGKNGGSFTATVKIENDVRDFSLTFLSNKHASLGVKSNTEGVNVTKSEDGLYFISVPADIDLFTITFYNSTNDNYRLDNIRLVEGGDPRINLDAPKNLMAMLNEDDANVTNSIDVVWDVVENAGSYVVTATPTIGDAVVKTVEGGTTNSYTITGLAYETEYGISIYAKSSDTSKYKDSAVVSYEEIITTGVKPAGGTIVTYQHIFTSKPGTGNNVKLSDISWNIDATNLNGYNSQNYAGVQFGAGGKNAKDGEIKLTSSSTWSYKSATEIKEVRLWLNLGGTSVTPSVTIGGKAAISDGTVVKKNTSAKSYADATKVTFTPVANGNTGVVVIDVTSVKAGYICAIEIDCM